MRKIVSTLLLLALLLTMIPPAFAVEGQTPSGIPFSELEHRIDELVAAHIGITTPGVAIVVVHEGEIIFSRGYGYADVENRVPFDPATTVSRHGSVNKLFVWTAAMQLVDRGLLDLDVDITTYLSPEDARLFDFAMPFTMRDLMNHSAGFADTFYYLQSISSFDWQSFNPRDTLLASQPRQIFTPGTVSAYSNWGSAFAAYIISQISALSFADYNLQNILLPAGMEHTLDEPLWTGNQNFMQHLAVGYEPPTNDRFVESPFIYLGGLYPGGASMGTAEDLARFMIALTPEHGTSGPLFEHRETLDTVFTLSAPDPVNRPSFYHGFVRSGVMNSIGHTGGINGFTANLAIVPEERFGWALLANTAGEFDIMFGLTHLLAENTAGQVLPVSANLPDVSAVEGRFIPARRTQGSLLDFIAYLGMANIRALDAHTIRLSYLGLHGDFLQIEPYVFRLVTASNPALYASMRELRFRMEDGEPVHIYATGADFTALPPGRTMPFLVSSLGIVVIAAGFFLITPVVSLVIFIVKKAKNKPINRTKFDMAGIGIRLCGLFLLINSALSIVFGLGTFEFTAASINPHIWINYLFAALSLVLFAGSLLYSRKEKEDIRTNSKVLFTLSSLFLALLIFTLFQWSFFTLL